MKTAAIPWILFAASAMAQTGDQSSGITQPPRYKFKPGLELVYEGSSLFKHDNGSHETTSRTTFWFTRLNDDGSWHVITHGESSFLQHFGNDEKRSVPPQKRESFEAFDIFKDGRIVKQANEMLERNTGRLFFQLPASAAAAKAGWEITGDDGDTSLCRMAPQSDADAGNWIFEKTGKGIFNEIYQMTSRDIVHYEGARGLITKIENEYSQGYGFHGKGSGTTELKSVMQKDDEWIAQLSRERDLYFHAKKAVAAAAESVKKGGKGDEAFAAARKTLEEGRKAVKLPEVSGPFDTLISEIDETAKYFVQEQDSENAVLNKPSPDWETTDLADGKHSLAGYRGRVVVLDFWYRGCGWCIRAMPQIKKVAAHYRGKPVAVLGMNTDSNPKDAQFVVDKLQLDYPTLKATGLPEKYKVRGFPTLVVIDPQGVVRAIHVGYSPQLFEDVSKTIDGLLAAKPGG